MSSDADTMEKCRIGNSSIKQYLTFIRNAVIFLVILSVIILRVRGSLPQALGPLPESPIFSGQAALSHLEQFTKQYHPWASEYNCVVGRYIFTQLKELHSLAALKSELSFQFHTQDEQFVDKNNLAQDLQYVQFTDPILIKEPLRRIGIDTPTYLFMEPRNIMCRIGTSKVSKPALLVTGHFDSAVASYGAFDDGMSIAVMLEVIRAILHIETKELQSMLADNDLIFLFGDGEEIGLLDAEAYLQHPWFNQTVAFINLEAGGNGRREMLFRNSDVEFSRVYTQYAMHPHVNSVMSELFALGLIPSDTNFRLLGKRIPGIDMAFYENRNSYHTPRDAVISMNGETLQHVGDNVLSVLKGALNSGYIKSLLVNIDERKQELEVHFDVLGLFSLAISRNVYFGWHFVLIFVLLLNLKYLQQNVSRNVHLQSSSWGFARSMMAFFVAVFLEAIFSGLIIGWWNPSYVGTHSLLSFVGCCLRMLLILIIVQTFALKHLNVNFVYFSQTSQMCMICFYMLFTTVSIYSAYRGLGALYLIPVWTTFYLASNLFQQYTMVSFISRVAVPFILTIDLAMVFIDGLAPIVLEGLPVVVVFVMFTMLGLLIMAPWFTWTLPLILEPDLAKYRQITVQILKVVVIVQMALTLVNFPYSITKSARVLAFFETTWSQPDMVKVTAIGASDMFRTISNMNFASSGVTVDLDSIDCDAKLDYGHSKKSGGVHACTFDVHNAVLFPNVTSDMSMHHDLTQKDAVSDIKAVISVPPQAYSCKFLLKLQNITSVRSIAVQVDDQPAPALFDSDQTTFALQVLRRQSKPLSNAWSINLNVSLDRLQCLNQCNALMDVFCSIDDTVEQVPFISQFEEALPSWAVLFTAGSGVAQVTKQFKIDIRKLK